MIAVTLCQPDGFARSITKVVKLRSSCLAAPDGLNIEDVRRVKRKDSLDTLVTDHSADCKGLVNSAPFSCDHSAIESLCADLIAFFDPTADIDNIPYLEVRDIVLQALILNGIQYVSLHEYISCANMSYPASR